MGGTQAPATARANVSIEIVKVYFTSDQLREGIREGKLVRLWGNFESDFQNTFKATHIGRAAKRGGYDATGVRGRLGKKKGMGGRRHIETDPLTYKNSKAGTKVKIIEDSRDKIAEVRVPLDQDVLVAGLEATHFFKRVNQLRNEFIVFSIIIADPGALFTWVLYRYQTAHLDQVQRFERRLAVEKEDAALGRASATITHEIRNPLNAISMGLQRLEIEADELDDEHRTLISNLRKAVQRTDNIITGLRRYANPLVPRPQKVRPDSVVDHILTLYRQPCTDKFNHNKL